MSDEEIAEMRNDSNGEKGMMEQISAEEKKAIAQKCIGEFQEACEIAAQQGKQAQADRALGAIARLGREYWTPEIEEWFDERNTVVLAKHTVRGMPITVTKEKFARAK